MILRVPSPKHLPPHLREQAEKFVKELEKPMAAARKELAKAERKTQNERLASGLMKQLETRRIHTLFEREYKFHSDRKWRLDLYARAYHLGVELHGGVWSGGRHTRGKGFTDDREKMNAAIECGITVLEYTPKEIADGSAADQIERIIKSPMRHKP